MPPIPLTCESPAAHARSVFPVPAGPTNVTNGMFLSSKRFSANLCSLFFGVRPKTLTELSSSENGMIYFSPSGNSTYLPIAELVGPSSFFSTIN